MMKKMLGVNLPTFEEVVVTTPGSSVVTANLNIEKNTSGITISNKSVAAFWSLEHAQMLSKVFNVLEHKLIPVEDEQKIYACTTVKDNEKEWISTNILDRKSLDYNTYHKEQNIIIDERILWNIDEFFGKKTRNTTNL